MAEGLMYKGHPLMRKDNLIYYGSMADSHIVMLQILETKKVNDMDIATRVSVQLQLTDPAAKSRDRVVMKSETKNVSLSNEIPSNFCGKTLSVFNISPYGILAHNSSKRISFLSS